MNHFCLLGFKSVRVLALFFMISTAIANTKPKVEAVVRLSNVVCSTPLQKAVEQVGL